MAITLELFLVRETADARQFENSSGVREWLPRSVCLRTLKYPPQEGQRQRCRVDVEDWWLEKHPWPVKARNSKQADLQLKGNL